jgi:hypothetical protein
MICVGFVAKPCQTAALQKGIALVQNARGTTAPRVVTFYATPRTFPGR